MAVHVWRGNQPVTPLSDSELEIFVEHISSGTLTLAAVRHALLQPAGELNVLKTLIPFYTSKVPWGSLAYHYSNQSINSLEAKDVYDKLVIRGRGGHCLEMVPLFAAALRALGYNLYMTGARISSAMTGDEAAGFHGWSHMVLIATIQGRKYVVDPQYIEITGPVLLDPNGEDVIFNGIPTTVVRLRYCALADIFPNKASTSGHMTWLFEYKRSPTTELWTPGPVFSTETEWFLEDLPVMNVWLAKAEESYLVTKFGIKRLLLAGADGSIDGDHVPEPASTSDGLLEIPKISGTVELAHDILTVFRYAKKVVDEKIQTEEERLEILKRWFGIILTKDEATAILSRPTALVH